MKGGEWGCHSRDGEGVQKRATFFHFFFFWKKKRFQGVFCVWTAAGEREEDRRRMTSKHPARITSSLPTRCLPASAHQTPGPNPASLPRIWTKKARCGGVQAASEGCRDWGGGKGGSEGGVVTITQSRRSVHGTGLMSYAQDWSQYIWTNSSSDQF